MYHNSFACGPEEPSSYTQNWVEAVGSLGAHNHKLPDLEDALATPSPFGGHEDEVSAMYAAIVPLGFLHEPSPADYWRHPDHAAVFHPVPGFTDDAAATLGSTTPAPSPASDTTLVDSPFALSADVELPWGGDVPVDQPAVFSPTTFHHIGLTSHSEPMYGMPTFNPSSAPFQQVSYDDIFADKHGQDGPGQQLSQHEIAAAAVVVPGPVMGMEVNADGFAYTSIDPMLFSLFASYAEPQQVPTIAQHPQWISTNNQQHQAIIEPAVEPDSPVDNEDTEPPKKKRKQSTEKRYACDYPGCTSTSARSHNIKIHKASVHFGERGHVCDATGCGRAFSRRHDLLRHRISAHTNLGSPRNPNNIKAAKGAMARSRAAVKKDPYEA